MVKIETHIDIENIIDEIQTKNKLSVYKCKRENTISIYLYFEKYKIEGKFNYIELIEKNIRIEKNMSFYSCTIYINTESLDDIKDFCVLEKNIRKLLKHKVKNIIKELNKTKKRLKKVKCKK